MRDGDDPDALGAKVGTLPGGRYLRLRLEGEPPAVYEQIAPSFEALARQAAIDSARPSIEFYRRRNLIDLLLPV
jgi:DNA gyrase inhibitor GyrI